MFIFLDAVEFFLHVLRHWAKITAIHSDRILRFCCLEGAENLFLLAFNTFFHLGFR